MEQMRAPLDFVGINLYYRTLAAAPSAKERALDPKFWLFPVKMHPARQGPRTDFDWEVWPKALYDIVMRITGEYHRPVIEITESGCSYNDGPAPDGVVHHTRRISIIAPIERIGARHPRRSGRPKISRLELAG